MKVVGVVTEYNPFHRGHEYHIEQAKALTGADFAVAIMSGDFVQRGTPAIFPKHIRAEMALVGGADLVLELPVQYASASAEQFACGAVSVLDRLGVVDSICFGCECDDRERLMEIAGILAREPDWYQSSLQNNLRKGLSYPGARAAALPDYGDILALPNNILGIEYCKALLQLGSSIESVVLKRQGSDYHETRLNQPFASAGAIRRALENGTPMSSLQEYFSPEIFAILEKEYAANGFLTEDDFSQILIYRLFSSSGKALCGYADLSEELASRMLKARNQFRSFSQFAALLKTREITRTHINRALLHLILNIKKGRPDGIYTQILGFRGDSRELLREIKKSARIPLITKAADYKYILNNKQTGVFLENLNASMIYEAVSAQKNHRAMIHEYSRPVVIL